MKFDIDARPAAPGASLPRPRIDTLPKNPERLAWLVLFVAFAACMLLTATVPLLVRSFLLYSVEAREASAKAISAQQDTGGTISLTLPNTSLPIAVKTESTLTEGSSVETDSSSRAFLTFFDGSTAQVQTSSRLLVSEMRQPRFRWSELPNVIVIDQPRGTVVYAAAPPFNHPGNPDGRPIRLLIHTPDFDATLTTGSMSIEVDSSGSQVRVREGSAVVHSAAGDRDVTVTQGQRLQAVLGQPLASPVAGGQNIISGGDFESGPLPSVWQAYSDQGGDSGAVNGSVGLVTVDDRRGVQIMRTGAGQNSAVTGIRQTLDKDLSLYRSLVFSAYLRVHFQSLSGGGYLSSEYPLIIRIKYRDVNGSEAEYVHGFYYQNDAHNPTKDGELEPQDQWVPFETSNLMSQLDPPPFRLVSISIYASGWDYESYVSGIKLTVE